MIEILSVPKRVSFYFTMTYANERTAADLLSVRLYFQLRCENVVACNLCIKWVFSTKFICGIVQ
jgi:hypothetical protein